MRLLFKQPPAVLRPNAAAPLDLRAARRVHGMRLQAKKRLRLQARLLVMALLRKEPERWAGFVPVRYDVTWFFWAGWVLMRIMWWRAVRRCWMAARMGSVSMIAIWCRGGLTG